MSVREEERQKNSNPSRGLGIATAALGVGVGAALYCFLSKKPENPDGEGSTTDWSSEQPHAFNLILNDADASMGNNSSGISSDDSCNVIPGTPNIYDDFEESIDVIPNSSLSSEWDVPGLLLDVSGSPPDVPELLLDVPGSPVRMVVGSSGSHFTSRPSERRRRGTTTSLEESYHTISETTTTDTSIHSDSEESIDVFSDSSDSSDWDVTRSSLDVPTEDRAPVSPIRMVIGRFGELFSPRPGERRRRIRGTSEEEHRDILRAQAFRDRSWSLEECSICFEIMLKDQDLTRLPCAHNFHSSCLAPWLAERQTCPNCRKVAE